MPRFINNFFIWCKLNRMILIIISLSFLASIIFSFYFRISPVVDARAYDTIAWNLVRGNGYRSDLSVDIQYDYAIARVGPLYEFFLAGIYWCFGHNYEFVWLFQAILHAASVWLLYLICLSVFDNFERKRAIGLVSAAIFGFYPDLIEILAMLMTETMYLFLLILMLYLFFRFFNRHSRATASALGFATAAAVLSRPPVLFTLPILIFYFIWKKQFFIGCLFLFCFFISFVPWSIRNYNIYGQPMPMGAAGSYNLWIGNHLGANGEQEQPLEALEFIASHPIKDLAGKSEAKFKNFIWDYPGEFLKLTLLRINKYFSVIRPMGFWFYQRGIGQIIMLFSSAIFSVFIFIFGFAGIFKSFKLNNSKLRYILSFTLITPLIIFASVVETRYRFQIYPFLSIFAGLFTILLWSDKFRFWANKVLWASIVLVLMNGAVDMSLSFDKIKEKLGIFS